MIWGYHYFWKHPYTYPNWPYLKGLTLFQTKILSIHSSNLKGVPFIMFYVAVRSFTPVPSETTSGPLGLQIVTDRSRSVPLPLKLPIWLVWRCLKKNKVTRSYNNKCGSEPSWEYLNNIIFQMTCKTYLIIKKIRPRCHSPSLWSGNSIPPARPWELFNIFFTKTRPFQPHPS